MSLFNSLKGKTVLITGASSGIGAATAKLYAELTGGEITLFLLARRIDKLSELRTQIINDFPPAEIKIFQLDISDVEQILQFGKDYQSLIEKVDILVNNAGYSSGLYKVGDINPKDVIGVINTNLTGLITLTQLVVPHYRQRNSGDVVNITSISGRDHYQYASLYCTTKAAVSAFTDVLRKETKDSEIRVLEILPGLVETEFATVRNEGNVEKAQKVYQIYKCLEAKDVAEQIAWATSRKQHVQLAETLILPTRQASMSDPDMVR